MLSFYLCQLTFDLIKMALIIGTLLLILKLHRLKLLAKFLEIISAKTVASLLLEDFQAVFAGL